MDRRPIIGFVLIFLIIIGYYFVMGQLYPAQPKATQSPTRSATETVADKPAATNPTSTEMTAAPATTTAALPGAFAGADSIPGAPLTMAQALVPQPAAGGPEAACRRRRPDPGRRRRQAHPDPARHHARRP